MAYRIRNWSKFQHFKDRRPPWVKLYRDLLDDLEWHELDAEAAKLLVMLWVIASEDDGNLPPLKTLAFRVRATEKSLIQLLNKLDHWLIQDDINLISDGNQDDIGLIPLARSRETEKRREETETETETPRRGATRQKTETTIPDDFTISDAVREWADKNGHDQLETHLARFVDACQAKGYKYRDWDAAFRQAISKNWAGVKTNPPVKLSADGKPYRDPLIYGFDVANGDPLPEGWTLPPTGETRYMPGFGWVLSSPRRAAA